MNIRALSARAAASVQGSNAESRAAVDLGWVGTIVALAALALALRVIPIFWDSAHNGAEIWRVVEATYGLLGQDVVRSADVRAGTNSGVLSVLLLPGVALGSLFGPEGIWFGARFTVALLSVGAVVSAALIGQRTSRFHGICAAFAVAIWFELVYLSSHALAEPVATALFMIFALFMIDPEIVSERKRWLSLGALMVMALAMSPLMIGVFAVLIAWERRSILPEEWKLFGVGALIGAIAVGLLDLATGQVPFLWLFNSITSLGADPAAGTVHASPLYYFGRFGANWGLAGILVIGFAWAGERRASVLLIAALANVLLLSAVPAKDYASMTVSITLIMVLAGLGAADIMSSILERRIITQAAPVIGAVGILAVGTSAFAATRPMFMPNWNAGGEVFATMAQIRNLPSVCGIALYQPPHPMLVARSLMSGDVPTYLFPTDDDGAAFNDARKGFNVVITNPDRHIVLPAGYRKIGCSVSTQASARGSLVCSYARSGGCSGKAVPPQWELNNVLQRTGW